MGQATWDRRQQDVGNIIFFEHVNFRIPDQRLATEFYIVGLGLTRDPYLMVGTDNMWANAGRTQFHMPTGGPNVAAARVGLVVPDLEALVTRLEAVSPRLKDTRFTFTPDNGWVDTTCPWGNAIRCHPPTPARFGDVALGLGYVEVPIERGAADGVKRFYEGLIGAPARVERPANGALCRVQIGAYQELVFREQDGPRPPYDGWHIAVYVADFGGPHARLLDMGLISEESNAVQYRFKDIVDPQTKTLLCELEHEVRSATHPMFLRPLVNRNPEQRQPTYRRGRDAYFPPMF